MNTFPSTLPLFPVAGALLLPHARLPLIAFEERYIALVEDALKSDRLVGMIQPRENGDLFEVGCAGRIVRYEELEDRRFIVLKGLQRFRLVREQEQAPSGYRRFSISVEEFANDESPPATDVALPRERLLRVLQKVSILPADFDLSALFACGDEEVINLLCILAPFAPSEKQALLEKPNASERSRALFALLNMQAASASSTRH